MTENSLKPFQCFQGLKFPDEQLIRHFFKNGLDQTPSRVLELGCGNGVNLALYCHYGWQVHGLDLSKNAIESARTNLGDSAILDIADLSLEFSSCLKGLYDVLLIPSVLYYLSREKALNALSQVRPHLKSGAHIYWRMRTKADDRYGKGELIAPDTFRLTISHTGEMGTYMCFYTKEELIEIAADHLDMIDILPLILRFDNVQNGHIVRNDEIILWGRVG